MRLETWLEYMQMSIDEFAKKIGKDSSLVFRYIHYNVIPKPDTIVAIYRETLGSVTANDFYRLSDKIFEQGFKKNSFTDKILHPDSFRF